MIKSLLLVFAIVIAIPFTLNSQTSEGFGIRTGLNYNRNGNYVDFENKEIIDANHKTGYHIGLFGKIGSDVYFKPELVYTFTKSEYNNTGFSMQKLDAPLLVGQKLLGHLCIFGGPSLQYIINSDFEDITIKEIDKDFTVGLNLGVGFNFDGVGIDVRYERGFDNNEATIIDENGGNANRLDTRPDQIIVSLSIIL